MLLSFENVSASFSLEGKPYPVLQNVNFSLSRGDTLGIVGESGSGKSTLAQAITRLTTASIEGKILFEGKNLLALSEKEMRKVRGVQIGHIFQDPLSALNPTKTIGSQIEEPLLYHNLARRKEAFAKSLELLNWVGLSPPELRHRQYPHELSGGMRQRALIAAALSCHPSLLIADEATTALDIRLQMTLLSKLKLLQKSLSMGLLLISHDIKLVSRFAEKLLVLYRGVVVEQGNTIDILRKPTHPYTQTLLSAFSQLKVVP